MTLPSWPSCRGPGDRPCWSSDPGKPLGTGITGPPSTFSVFSFYAYVSFG